jgi:hypothetical protein
MRDPRSESSHQNPQYARDHVDHDHADRDQVDRDHADRDRVDRGHVDRDHADRDQVDLDHIPRHWMMVLMVSAQGPACKLVKNKIKNVCQVFTLSPGMVGCLSAAPPNPFAVSEHSSPMD